MKSPSGLPTPLECFTSLAVGLLLLVAGCSKDTATSTPANPLPPAAVEVYVVDQGTQQAFEEVVGTVRPQLRSTIEAKVSGRIQQLPVVTGQAVQAGDLLAQLDNAEIQARLDQSTALREQADADLKRFTTLLNQEAVTRSEYEAIHARQRVAQASVTETETLLSYTRIVAPFDGVITRKSVEVGDLAAPGRTLLEIEDPSRLRLEAGVPEGLIDHLQLGSTLHLRIASIDQDLEGTVTEIAPTADPNTRTSLAKIDLPPHPALRVGQFGRASIPVASFAALRVPASAIISRGQLELAFVVRDHQAHLRLVRTGRRVGDMVEIVSGIEAGETVVSQDASRLLDGQPVQFDQP